MGLLGTHFDIEGDLGAGRQLFQDLGFDSSQDKGADELSQLQLGLSVLVAFDGNGVPFVEAAKAAEQARVDEMEEIPQFPQVVFNRCAGGDELELGL